MRSADSSPPPTPERCDAEATHRHREAAAHGAPPDRRREARLGAGDVDCEVEGVRFAHVLGLSLEGHGMRVLTEKRLPHDHPLKVILYLDAQAPMKLTGQVTWDKDQDFTFTHRYISGMQFLNPDPAETARLHTFITHILARGEVSPLD